MIPVAPQPEPPGFDVNVRQPGVRWLARKGIDAQQPIPAGVTLESYWTWCLPELRSAYQSICAYVCVYVELVVGNATVEHFVPKAQRIDLAYEWSNYRFICGTMNGRKSDFTDVLDPFTLADSPFELNFGDFRISVRSGLDMRMATVAESTIARLKLNGADCRKLRENHYNEYLVGDISEVKFRRESPFVHAEAVRLNMLR